MRTRLYLIPVRSTNWNGWKTTLKGSDTDDNMIPQLWHNGGASSRNLHTGEFCLTNEEMLSVEAAVRFRWHLFCAMDQDKITSHHLPDPRSPGRIGAFSTHSFFWPDHHQTKFHVSRPGPLALR